ncbi:MAG TPA: hypothetical protein PKD24_00970 [Pyrinomonadaceae bacterium]|nr:hypothetical protein [Pyrinomonadaceae bacterium]HMP64272.1 hypothetical protein [Pyrinomonadaceae bacterium]
MSCWIGPFYGLPQWFVVSHAFVHLAYGGYSLSLAVQSPRQLVLIKLLVFANGAWALFCFVFAAAIFGTATLFGFVHFVIEGVYVGTLAIIEWSRRHRLKIA